MSNSFFDWPAFASRFAPRTKARAEDVNAALDMVSTGFEEVEAGLALKAPLASPALTGVPTVPTPALANDSTQAVNSAWVHDLVGSLSVGLPLQTGHADEALFTTGTTAEWREAVRLIQRAIFSVAAATLNGVSNLQQLLNSTPDTGLGTAVEQIVFGNSLFVASAGGSASANVASSADGETWILRAMPSNSRWHIGTDGAQFLAVVDAGTGTASSANGTAWAAATALPAASKSNHGIPVFNGATCLVLSNTASTAYTSTDLGASWSTQTLPDPAGSAPFVVGGVFWYWVGSVVAHTSANGATGSWTQRNMPLTPVAVWQDFDGSLWAATSGFAAYYRTTDGINWVLQSIESPTTSGGRPILSINGVETLLATTFGEAATYHANGWVRRVSSVALAAVLGTHRYAKNAGGTVFMVCGSGPASGKVGRIAPGEASAALAVFKS